MIKVSRLSAAVFAGAVHLVVSLVVALGSAALVFGVWYPYPYGELAGGRELFILLVTVDVICGPLLTIIVFNPAKPRSELRFDIAAVVMVQVLALIYGLFSVMQARPVFLAFEGDQFRVVSVPDVQMGDINKALPAFRSLSLTGPRLIGVKLAAPGGSEYLQSIQLSLQGVPPAFRPSRWVGYQEQVQNVIAHAKPLTELRAKYPEQQVLIDAVMLDSEISEAGLGYLPLSASKRTNWLVVVDIITGQPKAFLPLDGW